jgi:protein-disulfide isomerase
VGVLVSGTETPPPGRSAKPAWVVAAIAALVALVSLAGPLSRSGSDHKTPPVTRPQASSSEPSGGSDALTALARRRPGDPTALGRVDAPVVMIAYSDFQCPFCGQFARDTEPVLVRKYVDTGVLRIEWRDFPYLGPESKVAAHAARAAAEQGKFWAFHDALYAHQLPPNSGHLTPAYLRSVAARTGLDVTRFSKDMNGPLAAKLVQHDFDEGLSAGVTGTPSFLVNGRPVVGALPVAAFEQVIEQARHAAGDQG